ncbi:MAG TPA: Lrp/AsnC family transcriptional regulator [Gemmatimonadaceae bacterium]|nr:Lrp/AsnC family transcriptional regulator [Gemmatimonadaceae bacterium]
MPQKIRSTPDREPLDRIDAQLVALLQQNARWSNKELAARIGLSESSTLARVRRLEARGVVTGYHAEVAPWALGIGLQALVAVRLARHARDVVERFRDHCRALPSVLAAYNIGGTDDFLVHVGVSDADALRELILTSISTRPEVTHIETHLIFDMVRGAAATGAATSPRRDPPPVRSARAARP